MSSARVLNMNENCCEGVCWWPLLSSHDLVIVCSKLCFYLGAATRLLLPIIHVFFIYLLDTEGVSKKNNSLKGKPLSCDKKKQY